MIRLLRWICGGSIRRFWRRSTGVPRRRRIVKCYEDGQQSTHNASWQSMPPQVLDVLRTFSMPARGDAGWSTMRATVGRSTTSEALTCSTSSASASSESGGRARAAGLSSELRPTRCPQWPSGDRCGDSLAVLLLGGWIALVPAAGLRTQRSRPLPRLGRQFCPEARCRPFRQHRSLAASAGSRLRNNMCRCGHTCGPGAGG